MKAVVYDRYGPAEVQRLEEVSVPTPDDDQILVKVHATTVTRTDCGWLAAKPFIVRYFIGLLRPKRKILGMEFAGVVHAVGAAVTEFATGDEIFGVTSFGAHAEYMCVKERAAIAHKPAGMTFEEAAAVADGACSALSCLRRAELREGRTLLVYGATGSIGSAAVQVAKALGLHVTAVGNTKNLELVRSLGADEVIDYQRENFTKNGKTYDIIFDAVGKHSFLRCRRSLKRGGIYIATDGLRNFIWWPLTARIGDRKAVMGISKYRKPDVQFLKELIETGQYRAVIDRTYALDDIVDATRYVQTGQKTGNVVLKVA